MEIKPGEKLADGRTAEVFAWGEDLVLKHFRPGFESGARYEYGIACAVQTTGLLAVPRAEGLIEVEGRPAILYQRVRGETLTHWLLRRPWRLEPAACQMAELHESLHRLHAPSLPRQGQRLRERLSRLHANVKATVISAEIKAALTRLDQLLTHPADRLCHGDFHPENILLTPNSSQPAVIIDWTDASQGDPFCDVARSVLLLTHSALTQTGPTRLLIELVRHAFARAYQRHYARLSGLSRGNAWPWDEWLLPLLVARLDEVGAAEYAQLLSAIRARMAAH